VTDTEHEEALKGIRKVYGNNLEAFFHDAMREMYNAATRTTRPPADCELKEISPSVFAWVKRTDDEYSDDNQ